MLKLISLILLVFVVNTSIVEAGHNLGPKWPLQTVDDLVLVSQLPSEWDFYIQAELAAWNCRIDELPSGFPQAWSDEIANNCSGITPTWHVTKVNGDCSTYQGEHICLGGHEGSPPAFTVLQTQGKRITYAGISMSLTTFTTPNYSALCHELGHALGLDHIPYPQQGEPVTCMSSGPSSMWPNAHDYEELVDIY